MKFKKACLHGNSLDCWICGQDGHKSFFCPQQKALKKARTDAKLPKKRPSGVESGRSTSRSNKAYAILRPGNLTKAYGSDNAAGSPQSTVTLLKANELVPPLGGGKGATINITDANQALADAWVVNICIGTLSDGFLRWDSVCVQMKVD